MKGGRRNEAIVTLLLSLPALPSAFHCDRRQSRHSAIKSIKAVNNNNEQDSRWKQTPFDFSSKLGWEEFYKSGRQYENDHNDDDGQREEDTACLEYEWHSHIPHSTIIETITPSVEAAAQQNSPSNDNGMPSILIIGCGNSSLPRVLHGAFSYPVRITCLDYSKACIDMMRDMYSTNCPNMEFVVGDAMKLKEVLDEYNNHNNNCNSDKRSSSYYDVIIDKGLMDALMCGEGFDVNTLQASVNQVLTPEIWGMQVLICFPLMKGTRESLVDIGKEITTTHLYWKFDMPVDGSENGRGSFNVAKRSLWKLEPDFETLQTSWN